MKTILLPPICLWVLCISTNAFIPVSSSSKRFTSRNDNFRTSLYYKSPLEAEDAARALLERARKMREEVAALEGRTVEQVEEEAAKKRQLLKEIAEKANLERQTRNEQRKIQQQQQSRTTTGQQRSINVPETPEDQVMQAKQAIERAFQDGITRQIVRLALVPEGELLNSNPDRQQWPGGAQQMYRMAAGPMTRMLLRQIRAPTKQKKTDDNDNIIVGTPPVDNWSKPPTVKSQDIWDFDGSALITAEAMSGPQDDVQAMVLSNTDNKYTEDIATISSAMKERLFLLINPFWRNIDSWGFNILAPNAKKRAQEVIFDHFQETYCLIQKTVRGEDCIALKSYPYDWQLYAYVENNYWPYDETIIYLGSTPDEPKSSDFTTLLNQRDEFKLSKNMRQMERIMNNNNNNN